MKDFVFLLIVATVTADRDPSCPFPSNELTFLPDYDDCTKFYECYAGQKSRLSCPHGLYWNQTAKVCDYNCDFRDITTLVPSSSSATTVGPQPTRDPMCPYPSDEVIFLPNRANCSIFYECYKGRKTEISCPVKTFWNQKAKTCDFECDFDDYTTIAPHTTPVSPEPTSNPMCPYPSEEITFIPNRSDCTKYYECYEGKSSQISCPQGTFWNQPAKACDYECDFGDLTTAKPYSGATLSPEICKDHSTGTYLPDPTNCRRFVECIHQKPTVTECPPYTYWNQYALTCVGGNC